MIGIVGYGIGNVQAISNIYHRLEIESAIVKTADEVRQSSGLILPGVGAFDWAMSALDESGLKDGLVTAIKKDEIPVLGICVGMQMLATHSDEGDCPGLGLIDGHVRSLERLFEDAPRRLPHMGWNDVVTGQENPLFRELGNAARFYFLHSYYFDAENDSDIIARSNYGQSIPCAVARENVFGVQFHPEKSHSWGIQLLKNFAEISAC